VLWSNALPVCFPAEATKSLPAFLLQPIKPPPHPEGVPIKKCFISVAASAEQIVTIGKAAERTWVRDMLKHCDVRCVLDTDTRLP
jgi:hypothetical protein